MSKVVLGLSGGMDSVTVLGYYVEHGYSVIAVSFIYGSKHNKYELQAAKDIVAYYKLRGINIVHHIMDISNLFENVNSNLLKSGGEIPEGHYEEEVMKATVVPGRNLIMASIMAAIGESNDCEVVALGVHSGDHHIYPDCRPMFIQSLNITIDESTEQKVRIEAPFLYATKEQILRQGYNNFRIQVPYHLTRTCYKDQMFSCGKCGSCVERLEAFEAIGRTDPIKYEEDE